MHNCAVLMKDVIQTNALCACGNLNTSLFSEFCLFNLLDHLEKPCSLLDFVFYLAQIDVYFNTSYFTLTTGRSNGNQGGLH